MCSRPYSSRVTARRFATPVILSWWIACGPGPSPEPVEAEQKPDPQVEPEPEPEPKPQPKPAFDPLTVTEIDARIVEVHDDHWAVCGVLHSVGALEVEVLGVGDPPPEMILFVSCPVDLGGRKLFAKDKRVTVTLHSRKQSWPKPPDKLPDDVPIRYVKTIVPWLGPTPDPITHPCVVTAAQFDRELDAADTSCKTDADCDCYPGGVTKQAGCGGITGAASAKKLHELAKAFREDGCKPVKQCAPRACEPRCIEGKCQG